MPWACPLKNHTLLTFQTLTAVLRKMQVFWYVTLQSVMLWSITVQCPTLIRPWWWQCYCPVKCSYHDPSDSASYPQDLNLNFPVHHSPVLVSSTLYNDVLPKGKPHQKNFQKLNRNHKQFIPEEVKQLAVCNVDTQCYEVCIYIYIILQWCVADGTCSLQLPTRHTVQEYEQHRSWLQCVSKLQDLYPVHDKFDLNLEITIFLFCRFVLKWRTNCIFQLVPFLVFVCVRAPTILESPVTQLSTVLCLV